MKVLEFIANIFKAIGYFFVMIGKGIVTGVVAAAKGVWWLITTVAKAIWWFIVLIAKVIYRVIAYLVGLAIRYFFVYLPALIMIIYALLLMFNVIQSMDSEIHGLWDYFDYGYLFTTKSVSWLTGTEHNFITAITLGVIQIALIVVAAIFDTLIIYVCFFGVGSLVWMLIQFILWMAFLIVIPVGSVIYSIVMMIKHAEKYNLWFYLLVVLISLACSAYYFSIIIPAFQNGF